MKKSRRLSDREIVLRFKECDDLLEAYRKTIQPAADELARRKSEFVFRRKGRCAYRGDLGCFEMGINTVCLHIRDWAYGKSKAFSSRHEKIQDRSFAFEVRWSRRLNKAGIKNLHVSGHF